MPEATTADVTVALITYNSARLLPDFFGALPAACEGAGSVQVVVADNASRDGSSEVAERLWPGAVVIRGERNVGYSAGINVALTARPPRRAAYILNPDIRVGPGSIARLLAALDEPGVGIAVPKLYERDGRVAPSLRREPGVLRALGAAVLGGPRAGRYERLGEVIYGEGNYASSRRAAWASGAAMMISRACMDAVGPWDESFFLYAEETDFTLRAADQGFGLLYVPGATAVHLGGEAGVDPGLWALSTVNRLRLFGRRHGAVRTAAFRGALLLNEVVRTLPRDRRHAAAAAALCQPSERAYRRLVAKLGGPIPGSNGAGGPAVNRAR